MTLAPTAEKLKQICEFGTFYCPAKKHYNNFDRSVVCDRCFTQNLKVCVGFETYDLCLKCVEAVVEINDNLSKLKDDMPTFTFGTDVVTRMMPNQYYGVKTRMIVQQFNTETNNKRKK
jgi:hypothetical protein